MTSCSRPSGISIPPPSMRTARAPAPCPLRRCAAHGTRITTASLWQINWASATAGFGSSRRRRPAATSLRPGAGSRTPLTFSTCHTIADPTASLSRSLAPAPAELRSTCAATGSWVQRAREVASSRTVASRFFTGKMGSESGSNDHPRRSAGRLRSPFFGLDHR